MKTAIRTPIVEAIRSVIQGGGGGPVSPVPLFYWKGQYSLAATTGTDPTFTRATAATFEDFEGLIKTVESSEPRFQGARRVENALAKFTHPTWASTGGGYSTNTTASAGVTDPDGGNNAVTVLATGASGVYRTFSSNSTMHVFVGQLLKHSIWVRRRTGTGTVFLTNANNGYSPATDDITSNLTSSWQRFTTTGATVVVHAYVGIRLTTSGDAVDIAFSQPEIVTGQTNQNPSEYVSTGVGTGPELIINGDFSNGTANWSASNTTLAVVDGECRVTFNTTSTFSGASQQITNLTIGKKYVVECVVRAGTYTGQIAMNIGGVTGIPIVTNPTVNTLLSFSFVPTVNSITFQAIGWTTAPVVGQTFFFDNFSVKEASHGANVDGVQYFNTLNANTVTSNVVTEAVGSPLTRANTQFGDLQGVASTDHFSTPNVVTTWGELDIRARAQVDSIPNSYAFLSYKAQIFFLALQPSGATQRLWFTASGNIGNISLNSAVFPTSQLGVRNWYRSTYNPATGDVKFFTADGNLEAPAISDYVQHGPTQNSGVGAIVVNTGNFTAGSFGTSINYPFDGDIYRSQVYNEIDGTTPVVDFTAGSYVSGSTLVSSTSGETWTLQGNASIFQPPVDESGPFGYLAEKASTNIVTYSQDLSGTGWNLGTGTTLSATLYPAPDGSTTANLVDSTTLAGFLYKSITTSGSSSLTLSYWARADTPHTMGVYIYDDVAGYHRGTQLLTGSWKRYSLSVTAGASYTFLQIAFEEQSIGEVYLWGIQLETSTYPTSYIPTTTTAVTRNADVLIAGDMVTDAAGSAYAEASSIWSTNNATAFALGRDYAGRIFYSTNTLPSTYFKTYDGSSAVTSVTGASYQNRPASMAATWGNNLTVYLDGVGSAASAYDGTMGAGNLAIGTSNSAGAEWNGTVREVKIFNSELTAEEVGDL